LNKPIRINEEKNNNISYLEVEKINFREKKSIFSCCKKLFGKGNHEKSSKNLLEKY